MTAPSTYKSSAAPHDFARPAYLSGFQTLAAEISLPALPVQGSIPEWLTGTLLRVGPGRYEWGPDRYRHWFDGSGMIHKFSFAKGNVGYANRYVRGTAFVDNERVGRITAQTFATDPYQELFRKGFVHYHVTGNANVNAITAGDMLMALGEAPLPIAIDPQTLETRGEWPWRDDILLDPDGKLRPQHTTPIPISIALPAISSTTSRYSLVSAATRSTADLATASERALLSCPSSARLTCTLSG
jgi:carotenoid cleavage dioxygenase-like enzyme